MVRADTLLVSLHLVLLPLSLSPSLPLSLVTVPFLPSYPSHLFLWFPLLRVCHIFSAFCLALFIASRFLSFCSPHSHSSVSAVPSIFFLALISFPFLAHIFPLSSFILLSAFSFFIIAHFLSFLRLIHIRVVPFTFFLALLSFPFSPISSLYPLFSSLTSITLPSTWLPPLYVYPGHTFTT